MVDVPEQVGSYPERIRVDVPEGHSEESGYCFRDALHSAGYNVDLPPWVHIEDVPIVCEALGLKYHKGKGKRVLIRKSSPCIIGHTVQRESEGRRKIGHWTFTGKPEETFQKIPAEDIFSIITFPEDK